MGQADVRKALSRSNVYNIDENAFTSNDILIEIEKKVRTRVKSPFSTALGIQYLTENRKNAISFTIEYFNDIAPYAVIDANNFLSYYHSANSVINAAIGFKQFISSSFLFLGGFRTDFTSGDIDDIRSIGDKYKIIQIHMDTYHITIGPVLQLKQFDVVTGIQYTFGRNKNLDPVINYANPLEYIPKTAQALEGIRQNQASARINEIALFFGITLDL